MIITGTMKRKEDKPKTYFDSEYMHLDCCVGKTVSEKVIRKEKIA